MGWTRVIFIQSVEADAAAGVTLVYRAYHGVPALSRLVAHYNSNIGAHLSSLQLLFLLSKLTASFQVVGRTYQ